MAISDLTDKILQDASESARDILTHAQADASAIAKKADEETISNQKAFDATMKDLIARNKVKITTNAEQEAKMTVDAKKREALDAAFKAALDELKALPDPAYKELLISLMKTLPEKCKGVLIVPTKRSKVTMIAAQEAQITLAVEESSELSSGFLIKGQTYDFDYSLEKIIEGKRDALEIEVARILFT